MNTKKRRPGKPWWSDRLSEIWSLVCDAEKLWLHSQCRSETLKYKSNYVNIRKIFDKEVQRAKRLHWYSLQKSLLDEFNVDQSESWKSVGKIGISYANKNFIPMEVTLDDSSVSFNIDDVLPKWQSDFSSLFTGKDTDLDLGNVSGNTWVMLAATLAVILLTRIPTVIPINK